MGELFLQPSGKTFLEKLIAAAFLFGAAKGIEASRNAVRRLATENELRLELDPGCVLKKIMPSVKASVIAAARRLSRLD